MSFFPLRLRFALSLVLSNLIMMCLGVIFFMSLMLVAHGAPRTCRFIVFIKLRKNSLQIFVVFFLELQSDITYTILIFKNLLGYFNSYVLIHHVIMTSQSILQVKCMTTYEIKIGGQNKT